MSIRDYCIYVLNSNVLENIRINPNQFNDIKNRPFGWFFNSVLFVGRTDCLEEHPVAVLGLVSAVGGPSASRGKKFLSLEQKYSGSERQSDRKRKY